MNDEGAPPPVDSVTSGTAAAGRPTVSVLVLNHIGRLSLDACLSSLEAQAYPRDRFEIVLVDTGSTGGSSAFMTRKFPRARVFGWRSNQGFGAPHNAAIESCETEFVALLNNDARVDPHWLAELVSAAQRHDAAAVASTILNSNGDTIDFAGGAISFNGQPWQLHCGEPATRSDDERPLLYSSAASTLYSRAAFLDAGGFDEKFFSGLEDVDLGWRLNLFGGRVVLARTAVTYRITGTSATGSAAQQGSVAQHVRLAERNALAMIYKNYEAATLERVFPAAVALLLLRATMRSGIDSLKLALSDRPLEIIETHPQLAARLIGLEDFGRQLPAIERQRDVVQQRRRRSDAALFELFGDPLHLHDTTRCTRESAARSSASLASMNWSRLPARPRPRSIAPRSPRQPPRQPPLSLAAMCLGCRSSS